MTRIARKHGRCATLTFATCSISRKWQIRVQADAQRRRVSRLHEWLLHGHSYTFRFDNCDVGKLLHFIAVIATRDRCPPERPFPYAPPSRE